MAAGFDQLTAYTSFEWPVDRTAVVRWNVELLLRWMINGSPPDDYFRAELHEFLRDRAIAGQPIEDSILVYRRGVRKFWEALLDLAGEEDRAVLLAEWDTVWSCLEDCLDLVVDVFAQAYADQQDAPSTAGDRRARALFDRLCARLPVTIEDRERAARLGFDLMDPYCRPFTSRLSGAAAGSHAGLAARLRAQGHFALHAQRYVSEGLTPIEDGAVERKEDDSPWHHVATLTIPAQDLFDQRGRATRDRVDTLAFDPWRAPADLPARQPQPRPPYGLHGQRERVDAR